MHILRQVLEINYNTLILYPRTNFYPPRLVPLMPFYRRMVEAHRVLISTADKHIDLSKEAIRSGNGVQAASVLAKEQG